MCRLHGIGQTKKSAGTDTEPLIYDGNGITGPDWGHSEQVLGNPLRQDTYSTVP